MVDTQKSEGSELPDHANPTQAEIKKVDWKQAFANAGAVVGVVIAALGAYATFKSLDWSFQKDSILETSLYGVQLQLSQKKVENLQADIKSIRDQVIEIEGKIEKIDTETISKDKKTGVFLTGENLKMSEEVAVALENLNKSTARLPENLAGSVNNARVELYNRYQNKVFTKHLGKSEFEANPYYIRQFDRSVDETLKGMVGAQNAKQK